MPGSTVPVIRQPFAAGDDAAVLGGAPASPATASTTSTSTPASGRTATGDALEAELVDLLRTALTELEAPDDQLVRLGLT